MKRIINIILIFALLLTSASCTGGVNACAPEEGLGIVTVTVTGPDGDIVSGEAGLLNDTTAFDATLYVLMKERVQFEYSGKAGTAYFKGINNIYEFDYGATSGWIYSINGSSEGADKSCGAYVLKDGDAVNWVYTKDGGKDTGLLD